MSYGLGAYKKTSVETASKEQILLMLYQAAIKNCKKAIEAIEQKNLSKKGEYIGKMQDIIVELSNSLDFEVGGEVAMTPAVLETGSDRVAYVAKEYPSMDVVINLQGDEPFIHPETLAELIAPYQGGENPEMATLGYALDFDKEYHDPGIVKVIMDQKGYAIYFSRAPIPYIRQSGQSLPILHHMGLYAYQRDFLLEYTNMPQTPLEKTELLEQLRAIENGYKIRVNQTHHRTLEINTPEELQRAQEFYNLISNTTN